MDSHYDIPPSKPPRAFWQYLLLMGFVLCAGYSSRKYSYHLPVVIRKRTGDALWADAIFVLVAILRPRWAYLFDHRGGAGDLV